MVVCRRCAVRVSIPEGEADLRSFFIRGAIILITVAIPVASTFALALAEFVH